MEAVLAEEVAHGEVGELQSHLTDDTCLSPSERELNLVTGFRGQTHFEVDGSIDLVGLDPLVRIHGFRIEMSHLCNFHVCLFEGIHGEEVTGFQQELTTHNFLVHTGVTINLDFVDSTLDALGNTDFEVDGVAIHIYFHTVDLIEDITLVEVAVGH